MYKYPIQRLEYFVRQVILNHSGRNQNLVIVGVVGPDGLKDWLSLPNDPSVKNEFKNEI